MTDGDLRDQISRIEADIEQLVEGLDRCRKVVLLAKVAIAAGGIGILAYFVGPFMLDPTIMIGALAAIIGGIVAYGSNLRTSDQIATALKAAMVRKDELIDMIELRIVDGRVVVNGTAASLDDSNGSIPHALKASLVRRFWW